MRGQSLKVASFPANLRKWPLPYPDARRIGTGVPRTYPFSGEIAAFCQITADTIEGKN
jgi:hypothetical protein